MVALSFIIFIILCLTADALIQLIQKRRKSNHNIDVFKKNIFDEKNILIPKGIYFAKSHTWAFMEMHGNVKTGIDDFLQHVTGQITRLEMKNNGEKVNMGEPFLIVIQKGKHLTINSPITGTVLSRNTELIKNPQLINSSPYANGWIYNIEPSSWKKETQLLMIAEKVSEWMTNEFIRLKDFLVSVMNKKTIELTYVYQDGGALKENVLASMGPEIWEDFQNKFIDLAK